MANRVLTAIENRFVVVENCIGDANDKLRELNAILFRRDNRDLFVDDRECSEWRGIRTACLVEAERLEHLWQAKEARHG